MCVYYENLLVLESAIKINPNSCISKLPVSITAANPRLGTMFLKFVSCFWGLLVCSQRGWIGSVSKRTLPALLSLKTYPRQILKVPAKTNQLDVKLEKIDDITSCHIFKDLNPEQVQAVKSFTPTAPELHGKPAVTVVLAGAGSGKTSVIVHRIAYLLQDLKVPPNAIIATTFTNKAADEIVERVDCLLQGTMSPNTIKNKPPKWIGTFHSLCFRMLLAYTDLSKVNNSSFLDEKMQRLVVEEILQNSLSQKLSSTEEAKYLKDSLSYIQGQKDQGLRAAPPGSSSTLDDGQIYSEYERVCKECNYIDFNEVLLRTYELLRDHPKVLDKYRKQFQYIHVDEYQDTNTIQYKIIRLLIDGNDANLSSAASTSTTAAPPPPPSLFIVGDDDQAIYGFRGAKPGIMQKMTRDYPQCALIKLTQNYRSTSTILKAANTVIANNKKRLGKDLWTAQDSALDEPIHLYAANTEGQEAKYIAENILRRVSKSSSSVVSNKVAPQEHGFSFKDVAVLMRNKFQSREIENALNARNIPYEKRGDFEFFQREEILHVLACLSLTVNRHDNLAFERVLNEPPRGLSKTVLEGIKRYANERRISLWQAAGEIVQSEEPVQGQQMIGEHAEGGSVDTADIISEAGENTKKKPKKSSKEQKSTIALASFLQLINHLEATVPNVDITSMVKYTIIRSGLYENYAEGAAKATKAALTYAARMENLVELVKRVHQRFCPSEPPEDDSWVAPYRVIGTPSIISFHACNLRTQRPEASDPEQTSTSLQQLLQAIKFDTMTSADAFARDAVQLSTIHGAKGLEFPVVFLCGAEQGILPAFTWDTTTTSRGDIVAAAMVDSISHATAASSISSSSVAICETTGESVCHPAVAIPQEGWEDDIRQAIAEADDASDLETKEEEERRLFYVATTRAKRVLFITHSKERRFGSKLHWNRKRSKFIDEISPQSLLLPCRNFY